MFKKSDLASRLDPARCESETTMAGFVGGCEKTAASQRGGHYCLQGGGNLVTRARPGLSASHGEERTQGLKPHSPTPASSVVGGPLCGAECMSFSARVHGRPHLRVHRMTHLSYKGRGLGGLFGTSKRLHNVILSLLCTHLHRSGEIPHVHAPSPRGLSSL